MSFANQALSAEYVAQHHAELEPQVYVVPEAIDAEVARLKLAALGIELDADDRRAGRLRRVLAARHLSAAADVEPDRRARTGPWRIADPRSSDLVVDAASSCSASPWVDGDDVSGSRAGRPRAAGRSSSGARRTARPTDLTPDAVQRPDPCPRVRRRRVPRRRRVSSSRTSPTAGCTGSTRAPTSRSPITPEGRGATPTCALDAGRRRFLAVREDHGRRAAEPSATRSSRSPLDGERRRRVLVAGPDFFAAPRLSPDGDPLAWLEWDHPDMPWDGTRLRVAPSSSRRHARRAGPGRRRPGRLDRPAEWAPDGTLHLVTDRSGWWNLYRLVDGPAARAARADGGRVRRPGLGLRALVVRLPARRLDRRRRPGATATTSSIHVAPGDARSARSRCRSPRSTRLRSAADASSRVAGPRPSPGSSSRLDPVTLAPAGVLRRATHGDPRPGGDLAARADRVPDDRRADGARPLLPADEPRRSSGPTASSRRSSS